MSRQPVHGSVQQLKTLIVSDLIAKIKAIRLGVEVLFLVVLLRRDQVRVHVTLNNCAHAKRMQTGMRIPRVWARPVVGYLGRECRQGFRPVVSCEQMMDMNRSEHSLKEREATNPGQFSADDLIHDPDDLAWE